MSVKISVFGGYFWRGSFVYILRKWIFIFTAFHPFSSFFVSFILPLFLSYFVSFFYPWFVPFVPLYFVSIVSRGGAVSLLTRWLTCHVTTLPHYHVIELPYYLRLRFEVSKTCHIVCDWRFEELPRCEVVLRSKICHVICALCVVLSYFAVEDFAVVGVSIDDPGGHPLTLLS